MNGLVELLPKNEKYNKTISTLKNSENINIYGLTDSQKAHITYSITRDLNKTSVIVCSNVHTAKKLIQDLKFFAEREIVFFPSREIVYFDIEAESKEIEKQRMYAINKIISKDKIILVTTIEAISQKMLPKETYQDIDIEINISSEIDKDKLVEKLFKIGYTRADLVEGPGQFAVRGGIIDIYPVSENMPYRIELWGDEIDSIRTFDKDSQRTVETVESFKIIPINEYIIDKEKIDYVVEILNKEEKDILKKDIEIIQNGKIELCIDKYIELIMNENINILDYIEEKIIILDEISKCVNKLQAITKENEESVKVLAERNVIFPKYAYAPLSFDIIKEKYSKEQNIYIETLPTKESKEKHRKNIDFKSKELIFMRKSMSIHMVDISKWLEENKYVVMIMPKKELVTATYNQLVDNGIKASIKTDSDNIEQGKVNILEGILSNGFAYDDFNLNVLVQTISGINTKKQDNKSFNNAGIVDFSDLKEGEYVVHINHGIGKYMGIKNLIVGDTKKDYICIKYDKLDTLYVPVSSLDTIRKYSCDEEKQPKLNSLGNKEWEKTKHKVTAAVKDIAKELIKLYAKRENEKGYAFNKDTVWQKEFEDSFIYQITEDQERCTNEIKEDMERTRPMERLLCGDVGFGKTEVAMRAAFKSIMDSKQVAYLVPTTVLAMQQYKTFHDRMSQFGIKVQCLSRMRTKKEQENILKELKEGKIDIIVGTHRLLSEDVKFKDIGLLIIDEEHRFGVKHKEKIKQYKNNIDVLSMTATPIPRTLHMSMIGIRDMSVITHPPSERLPVHTYVMEYDLSLIKNAIEAELERDGQVFYLYNKVQDIEDVVDKISQLVPEAKVAYAHGQMPPKEIEQIMMDFVERKTNVLVCTTILESGIDIPNANTIIVENSDRLGLAQLYQIRGRVGRSTRLAHAYITYKRDGLLTDEGEKRLRAIKDFTEFGSGHKIALRDLEIRGAGNLLGSQQHGHLLSVGYDLYCKMLELAIESEKKQLSGEEDENTLDSFMNNQENEVKIDVEVSAYIPERYILNDIQKIEMYQKIANIKEDKDSLEIIDELIDRYGNVPKEVENLIRIVEIRNLAKKMKINSIKQLNNTVKINNKNKYVLTSNYKNDILLNIHTLLKTINKKEGSK